LFFAAEVKYGSFIKTSIHEAYGGLKVAANETASLTRAATQHTATVAWDVPAAPKLIIVSNDMSSRAEQSDPACHN